jgi:hypothetical protein
LNEFIEEAKGKKAKAAEPKKSRWIRAGRALDAVLGNITKRFGEAQ